MGDLYTFAAADSEKPPSGRWQLNFFHVQKTAADTWRTVVNARDSTVRFVQNAVFVTYNSV